MPDRELATAADYADAMLTARRAKHGLILLLILLILGQLTAFFLVRFEVLNISALTAAATQPAPTTQESRDFGPILHYVSGACLFLGVTTTIVLSFVILLIVNIMLVGRLIGVARLTSSYVWCLVLLVLLFPWQAFLNNVNLTASENPFKVPGVLWTWDEFTHPTHGVQFSNDNVPFATLKWTRYVGMPVIALGMLLVIQGKTNRGMRQALGEDEDLGPDHAAA